MINIIILRDVVDEVYGGMAEHVYTYTHTRIYIYIYVANLMPISVAVFGGSSFCFVVEEC